MTGGRSAMAGHNPLDNPDIANPYIAARNEWNSTLR